jgi:anti-anti-sigma factor
MEVRPVGRLDGSWADHLSDALEDLIRKGNHRIRLNLSGVVYISSLGIRVLVTYFKKVAAIDGTFVISEPSASVGRVLSMAGLSQYLKGSGVAAPTAAKVEAVRQLVGKSAAFEVFPLGGAGMRVRAVGDPGLLEGCRFAESSCQQLLFPDTCCALGLGAFGHGYSECQDRFGEFLAVAGAAAYQPSGGSNTPDYLLSQAEFVPEMQVLYGAVGEGQFQSLARFEAKPDSQAIGLAELADTALGVSDAESAWMVIVAESAGLVGASLRRSPVNGTSARDPFGHPEIRTWLSFTTERAYTRALVVAVGLASRSGAGEPDGFLRPLSGHPVEGKPAPVGHFHAAPFSYRPLQRGLIDMNKTVRSLFEDESLLGLLHLIGDDRESSGVSESEFVRGACWIGPIVTGAA